MSRREELLAAAAFNALIRLPERERLLAIMHFVMGMAPRAIAAAIGLTARSVSTAIGRTKVKLRSQAEEIAAVADVATDFDPQSLRG